MARFSTWNESRQNWDYWNAAHDSEPPTPPTGPNGLGVPPEDAAVRLPLGARHVGTGSQALGRVAERGVNLGSLARLAVIGLAIYGGYMVWYHYGR